MLSDDHDIVYDGSELESLREVRFPHSEECVGIGDDESQNLNSPRADLGEEPTQQQLPDINCDAPILQGHPWIDTQNRNMIQNEHGIASSCNHQNRVIIELTNEGDKDGMAEDPAENDEVFEVISDTVSESKILDTTSTSRSSSVGVSEGLQDNDCPKVSPASESTLNSHHSTNKLPTDISGAHRDNGSIKLPPQSLPTLVHNARDALAVFNNLTQTSQQELIGNAEARGTASTQSLGTCLPPPMLINRAQPTAAARHGLASYMISPGSASHTQQWPKSAPQRPSSTTTDRLGGHIRSLAQNLLAAPTRDGAPAGTAKENKTVHVNRPPWFQVRFDFYLPYGCKNRG